MPGARSKTAGWRLANGHIRLEGADGAVASVVYRRAASFPLIAGRGAGVAAFGQLWRPALEIGGAAVELGTGTVQRQGPEAILWTAETGPGIVWERRLRLGADQSGFSLRDTIQNRAGRACTVRLGWVSRQAAAPWRLTDRSWIGDEKRCLEVRTSDLPVPGHPPYPTEARLAVRAFFWRQVGQYGAGLLCRTSGLGKGELTAAVAPGPGRPVEICWRSAPIRLAAGARLRLEGDVSVDEGGGAPDQNNAFAPLLVRSDFAAGRPGEPLIGFATVVSPRRRRVTLSVRIGRERARHSISVTLEPGKVARLPVVFHPLSRGRLSFQAEASAGGQVLAAAQSASCVGGPTYFAAWKRFAAPMPGEEYGGTWEQIGETMVRNTRRIGGPTSIEHTIDEIAAPDNDLAFYRQHLPFYAGLVAGMARAVGVAPERLGLIKRGQRDKPVACMDVACYGPDGPINAFSKERDGPDYEGLGYVRVIPTEGYAFHTYMHHGVNAAGLSISGATLNEDEATARAAQRGLAARKAGGGHTMPPAAGTWMLLAMCATVEEALALIGSPAVPWEQTGNMLLLDRAGRAARVESAGLERQIFRHAGRGRAFFVAGNYPHERPDGSFRIGARWGQAANTLLRERFLREFAGARQGRLTFEDVLVLMQAHETGGMCQHHHDNPGQLETVCSSIAVTRTSDLWLTQGPPCQVQYVRHRLFP